MEADARAWPGEPPWPAFVVVSGLPASGKTTLAAALARQLGWPHLDKDAWLEARFEEGEAPSLAGRAALSRQADEAFERSARSQQAAVLSSWWRHPRSEVDSGTPTAWLMSGPHRVAELHCRCSPATALQRFLARRRHPGHADALRVGPALERQFAQAAPLGPLFPSRALVVDAERPLDAATVRTLADRVSAALAAARDAGPAS